MVPPMNDDTSGKSRFTMPLPSISIYQPRGQCIVLLFAALRELGGSVTKQTAVQYILSNKWFALEPEDLKPYPSQLHTREARWKTLIAWARKDSTLRELMLDHERDSWSLSREGIRRWDLLRSRFATGEIEVKDGYLWSPAFKHFLCSTYRPCLSEAKRPSGFYNGVLDFESLWREAGL